MFPITKAEDQPQNIIADDDKSDVIENFEPRKNTEEALMGAGFRGLIRV